MVTCQHCGKPCAPLTRNRKPRQFCSPMCAGAAALSRQSHEQHKVNGGMGGRSCHTRWIKLLERWQSGLPREALREAWLRGYTAGYAAKERAAKERTAE